MVSNEKLANAVGAKTARACDSCISKRARWYCAADDAFLCQACDSSVHSANLLARRHERVHLKISSSLENSVPSWHQGFTKKARTPRNGKHATNQKPKFKEPTRNLSQPLVPELCRGEISNEENEEEFLYRVPTFESKNMSDGFGYGGSNLHGSIVPSEVELAEFAADVESLLGKGLEEESFDMEALGIVDWREKESVEGFLGEERVKVEDEEEKGDFMANHVDVEVEPFDLNFDFDSIGLCEEGEYKVGDRSAIMGEGGEGKIGDVQKKKLLRLDYEGVSMAWANQRSPWTTGDRPELDPSDQCWTHCMGSCGTMVHHPYGGGIGGRRSSAMVDGDGREARVSRYREKRRRRLFSKKIRYEVRKLNAEKRPRIKGRFVKTPSFAGLPSTFSLGF